MRGIRRGNPRNPVIDLTERQGQAVTLDAILGRGHTPHKGMGIIAPFDLALDRELWRWTPDDVSVHITRTPNQPNMPVDIELARAVSNHAAVMRATEDVSSSSPLAVGYACTSGSFIDGIEGERMLRDAMCLAGAPIAVTTSGAMLAAFSALGLDRVAVATPYLPSIAACFDDFLNDSGVNVVGSSHMNLDGGIWKISYADVVRLVLDTNVKEAQAIFISCTNVPTYDIIGPLERELGKPILSANQVTMWAMLRAAGLHFVPSDPQKLFSLAPTSPCPPMSEDTSEIQTKRRAKRRQPLSRFKTKG
jgi:maleate isomerase